MADKSITARDAAAFALGTASALVLGRVARVLIAKGTGMVRERTGGDVFERLTADHRRVLAALTEAETADNAGKRASLFATIKLDLSKHALAEEDVVYPLIADKLLAADAASHLYKDHGLVKTMLAEVEEALEAGDDLRYTARVRALRESVERHAKEEETQWFPQLRSALDEQKRTLVGGKVEREKALLG